LQKIITELDQTINKKFDLAFNNINEQFQKYFDVLFGGGKARLIKNKVAVSVAADSEAENSEESDEQDNKQSVTEEVIDIKATPPGKKLRELSMLSGGEKALTSIALLFAIITNNPTPFVILDEVDAALDESNTGRYADIISSLADKSQFIIITRTVNKSEPAEDRRQVEGEDQTQQSKQKRRRESRNRSLTKRLPIPRQPSFFADLAQNLFWLPNRASR